MKKYLQSIYDARDTKEARRLLTETIKKFQGAAPKAVILMKESLDDIMAVTALPAKYRRRLRTTNGIERLNEEIRRRNRVIRIYPDKASAIWLIGALLIEHDEKWSAGRKYFDIYDCYDFFKPEQDS